MTRTEPQLSTLDRNQVWSAIDAQRLQLADLLESLSASEWERPSLCAGWTVRDVAAHLNLQQVGLRDAAAMFARSGGNFDRAIREAARRRAAAASTEELIATIRGMVGSRRHNLGVTYLETLIDILVHGQDIAVPLDRRHDMPPEAAATAATRAWTMRWPPPIPATKAMKGYRLTATDTAWSVGDGPEVRGPISAILLVACGRLVALPQLSGDGAPNLTARLSP